MVNFAVAGGALALLGLWALKTYHKYCRSMDAVGWLPGPRNFFSARALFARLLPNIPYVNRKPDWPWRLKYDCRHSYLPATWQILNLSPVTWYSFQGIRRGYVRSGHLLAVSRRGRAYSGPIRY